MTNQFLTNYTEITFLDKIKDNLRRCKSFAFSVSFIKKAGLVLLFKDILRSNVDIDVGVLASISQKTLTESFGNTGRLDAEYYQPKYDAYLNQEFDTCKPNEVWVSDVTYFKYGENAYYICVIIDLFSRMVVGYKIGKTNSTQLVKSTFQMAYKARQPDSSLVFHTDRGGNYRSKTMNDYMRSLHITHSFSRAHVPYDNSVMESFFASLKREELYRTKYRSEADFRSAVDKYIVFFNTKRPHKKLQYKTPEQKEEEYALKLADL